MVLVRWPVLIGAIATTVLAAFTLYFTFEVYHEHRLTDFAAASKGTILGTCVGSVTDEQLKSASYDSTGWSCSTNSKENLGNLLAASVHSIYQKHTGATPFTGNDERVALSVISATLGGPSHVISRAQAYSVLSQLGTPTSTDCAVIYSAGTVQAELALAPKQAVVACDADYENTTVVTTTAPNADQLRTHCSLQHSYAYSWPKSGTFGIPLFGTEAKPIILPVLGVNDTTTPGQRAQILVGTRFGFSAIVYILFVISGSFFCMDGIILGLAELTRADAYRGQNAIVEGGSDAMRAGMMTMLATFKAKRNLRWAVAILLIVLETVAYLLLIGVPWFFARDFPRPICETGKPQHWIGPFSLETMGGWKKDIDAFYLEVLVVASHILILVVLPILSRVGTGGGSGGGDTGRDRTSGEGGDVGYTGVAVESLRTGWWLTALVLGGIALYLGTAVAEFRFGYAWAEGVVHNRFDEVALGGMIADSIDALLYLSITVGLTLGSVVTRWLLSGLSCTSFTIFVFWIIFALAAFIPPFFVSAYYVFWSFEGSKGQENCQAIFGDSSDYLFARTACDVQAGTYIAGIILLLVAVAGPIVLGLVGYFQVLRKSRRRSWVSLPADSQDLTFPRDPRYATELKVGGGDSEVRGYRSNHTNFFNFESKLLKLPQEKKPLL